MSSSLLHIQDIMKTVSESDVSDFKKGVVVGMVRSRLDQTRSFTDFDELHEAIQVWLGDPNCNSIFDLIKISEKVMLEE